MLIAGLFIWFLRIIYDGFALTILWEWFIVPFGVTSISIPWAIGITCTLGLLKIYGINTTDNKENGEWGLLTGFIATTIIIAIGYVSHNFM